MKRLGCLLVSFCLVLGILLIAVADVNHGHGPGYVASDNSDDHGESGDGHGEVDDHGNPVDSHEEPSDSHDESGATTIEQVH